jgi:ketosteroid isomerase-like protein
LFDGPHRVQVEFWDYDIVEAGDGFVAIGRERGMLVAGSGETLDLRIRTSRFFRRHEAGRWRQVHHHGSMDEPDLLASYQRLIRGRQS